MKRTVSKKKEKKGDGRPEYEGMCGTFERQAGGILPGAA
jgi:hypothetical protein